MNRSILLLKEILRVMGIPVILLQVTVADPHHRQAITVEADVRQPLRQNVICLLTDFSDYSQPK